MEIKTADGTYIYTIDFTPVRHYRDLYSCINEGFELTGRVGENRDALWDCLTGFIDWPCEIRLSGISSLSKQRRAELKKSSMCLRTLKKRIRIPFILFMSIEGP